MKTNYLIYYVLKLITKGQEWQYKNLNGKGDRPKLYFTLNPQLHSRSATYIKRNELLIRKTAIKSSHPFQYAYHSLTP